MTAEDLRTLRAVVANIGFAFDLLEERSERFFEAQTPSSKGWLTRAERGLDAVVLHSREQLAARDDLWDRSKLHPAGSVEDATNSLTALLDLFPDVDPAVIYDEAEPFQLPDDEYFVCQDTLTLACALEGWGRP